MSHHPPATLHRLLVAVDSSTGAAALAEFAGNLALNHYAEVHLLHAHPYRAAPNAATSAALREQRALRDIQKFAAQVKYYTQAWSKITYQVVSGDFHAAVLREAGAADLLLLGQSAARGIWRGIADDRSDEVLEDAPCPVLVVPADAAFEFPSVLAVAVGPDASLTPDTELLRRIARKYRSRIEVFHRGPGADAALVPRLEAEFAEFDFAYRQTGLSADDVPGGGLGGLTRDILSLADRADPTWLVVTHERRDPLIDLLSDGVSERVAAVASVPVLILHRDAPQPQPADGERATDLSELT